MVVKVIIERGEDGYFVAHCPTLKSCWTQGKTREEALSNMRNAIDLYLEPVPIWSRTTIAKSLRVGMFVPPGGPIQPNTFIQALDATGQTVTLTQNATASVTNNTLTFIDLTAILLNNPTAGAGANSPLTFKSPGVDTTSLATYFNTTLRTLFETGVNALTLLVPNPGFGQSGNVVNPSDPQFYTFSGTRTTTAHLGSDNQNHNYKVIQFTGTVTGTTESFYVYEPLFSTNTTDTTLPPAVSFLTNRSETPGSMVLGNDGVFADNLQQFGFKGDQFLTNRQSLLSNLLGNIENQIVTALNRGVSSLQARNTASPGTNDWADPSKFYQQDPIYNAYSKFLHTAGIAIDGHVYGFAFDDQGNNSSTLTSINCTGLVVNLGGWTSPPPSTAVPTVAAAATPTIHASGAGFGDSPLVQVFNENGIPLFDFFAYDVGFTGGVHVATGDVTGDGHPDIITGAGPGGGPHVKVFSGIDGSHHMGFFAFNPLFTGGVSVASGDVNADGFSDIIVGAGPGGGPDVKVFSGKDGAQLYGFFAFDPLFTGGVNVALGDVNADGFADMITAAGPGGGPDVKVFSGKDGSLLASAFAYDMAFTGGVHVAAGNINGSAAAEVITGPGAGGGPDVKVFNGLTMQQLDAFFAYDAAVLSGVLVKARDVNNDDRDEILTKAVIDGADSVKAFDGITHQLINGTFPF